MNIDYQAMIQIISQVIWPMGRISGLILIAPVFSSGLVSKRIRVFFILALSWFCSSFIPPQLSFANFNGLYLVYIVQEIAFGFIIGFTLQLVLQVFALVGQIISMQAGLSFAVMIDPSSKASVPLLSQLYLMLVTLVFLTLNGHITLLEALINSFKLMPIGHLSIDNALVGRVLFFSAWMFKEAVLISIPAIVSLLLVSLSFGIMTRVAPQLNIFSLGFPITIMVSILVVAVFLPTVGAQMIDSLEQSLHFILSAVTP